MKIILSAIALLLLIGSASAQTIPPALGLGAATRLLPSIQSLSYQITVPPYPINGNTGAAYEFHLGILTGNNNTFIKATVGYGCNIQAHIACYPPFQNRYIFYLTILNQMLNYRTQYPANGVPIASNETYSVTMQFDKCNAVLKALTFSISNSTWHYTQKICNVSGTFNRIMGGLIEIHNMTNCNQLSSSDSMNQTNIFANQVQVTTFSMLNYTPPIDCNFTLVSSGNNLEMAWQS